jgi:hypothetical protein
MDTPIETVGLQVWRGACLMADFLIHNAHKFDGIYALEVGAGSGARHDSYIKMNSKFVTRQTQALLVLHLPGLRKGLS